VTTGKSFESLSASLPPYLRKEELYLVRQRVQWVQMQALLGI
jgi:hypothetical protein